MNTVGLIWHLFCLFYGSYSFV